MMLLQRSVRYLWTAIIVFAVFLTSPALSVRAQKTVFYDQPVTGQITDTTPQDTWTVDVPARDRIAITVSRTDGSLIPTLEILDSSGQRLANADIDPTAGKAIISNFKFPAGGLYTIVIGRDNGQSAGTYQLMLTLRGVGPERPELYTLLGTAFSLPSLTYHDEISNDKWLGFWSLLVRSKDQLRLTVKRQDGTLLPTLALLDSQDQVMVYGNIDSTGAQASVEVTLPAPGAYKIRVSRKDDEDGETIGNYTLMVENLGLGEDNEIFSSVQGWAHIDMLRPGRILASRWQETWALSVDQPLRITVTVQRTSGTLVPRIKLLDANHNTLLVAEADDTLFTAAIRGYMLSGSGQYFVVVGRQGDASGRTEGAYQLLVTQESQRADLFSSKP